jgi:uncharacterized protein YceH (UPF0502 family)
MLVQLTAHQARVIGVLIEKEITTPDQYPLSLNALTLGCNQKSSREPIMHLSESEVQNILDELRDKNLLFEHQSSGSRVVKYKHRFCNTEFSSLKFTPQQLAIICVLLLRGPQTPGELRTRTNRLAEFANVNEVESTLHALSDFNSETIVVKLEREPGKRESRYAHLFSGEEGLQQASSKLDRSEASTQLSGASDELEAALQRILTLEEQVEALSKRLDEMQETLDILSS